MSDWKEATVGDGEIWDREKAIQGTLVKKQENIGPNESFLYTLRTKDGDVGVWGSSVLDTKFQEIEVGYEVKVEPLGKTKSPKTGREYFDYKVMYRPAEMIESGYEKAKAVRDSIGGEITDEDVPPEYR
jgi:hypothetical protein